MDRTYRFGGWRAGATLAAVSTEEDIDLRPDRFVSMQPESLREVARSWPRPTSADTGSEALLAKSRRLFVGSFVCYDNLAQSVLVALQAAELALRVRLMPANPSRGSFRKLLESDLARRVLAPEQLDWYDKLARHFRNVLAHPDGELAFSPGMAAGIIGAAHGIVCTITDVSAAPIDSGDPGETSHSGPAAR
jgi:hypothetical protein